jgi:cell division protein FtsN
MSDNRPDPDKRPDEGGEDVKRQIKKRIAIAGALVAVALAAIPILNSLNKSKVETTASNPQSSSGRIISPASSEPLGSISSAIESSAPAPQASEPAHAAPGLPSAPATEKTPSVAATQTTPPVMPTAPQTAAPFKQAKPPVTAPTVAPAPATAQTPAPLVPRATAKAPPAPVETAEPAVKGGSFGYNVQLGLFSSLDNALKLANALKAQGIPVKTETRVHVGPFRTRAEAEETMAKLKSLGYNPLLQAATQ